MILKELILTVSPREGCGGLERTKGSYLLI